MTEDERFTLECARFRSLVPTPRRRELFDAMLSALGSGWAFVAAPGFTIRWGRDLPMPDAMKADVYGKPTVWAGQETYRQLVFLQLPTPASNPLLKVWRAPWVNRQDTEVTLGRAFEVLARPEGVFDR